MFLSAPAPRTEARGKYFYFKTGEEIERRFLVKHLPENLEQYPCDEIVGGYLAIPATENKTAVRIRQKGRTYIQAAKRSRIGSQGIEEETEIEITREQFQALWPITEGKRICKTRYKIPYAALTIELDIYHGDLAGFSRAEVEFFSEKEREEFVPLEWFGKEVTLDKRYRDYSLALHGRPKDTEAKKEIAEHDFEEGVQKLISLIKEKVSKKEEPTIVKIAGGSSSGKTEVALKALKAFSGDALYLCMDDYYKGKSFKKSEAAKGNILTWDHPEVIDFGLLKKHLQELKEGKAIDKPVYDYKTGEREGYETMTPKKIIIVDGLFALADSLASEEGINVFVETKSHGRLIRRLLRDVYLREVSQNPFEILEYFCKVVEPLHKKHVEPTKKNADIIIRNEYIIEVEVKAFLSKLGLSL